MTSGAGGSSSAEEREIIVGGLGGFRMGQPLKVQDLRRDRGIMKTSRRIRNGNVGKYTFRRKWVALWKTHKEVYGVGVGRARARKPGKLRCAG